MTARRKSVVTTGKPPVNRSRTPPVPAKGNGHAVRHGAAARGENLATYDQARLDVNAAVAEAVWLKRSDAILVEMLTSEWAAYQFASDSLRRLGDVGVHKKVNASKLLIRRAKLIAELCDRLGLSPKARMALGLTQAKTERATVRVVPVKSQERAQAVAELLASSGALPPVDAEVVPEAPEAEVSPTDVQVIPEDDAA